MTEKLSSSYSVGSAGHAMVTNVPTVPASHTLAEVRRHIEHHAEAFATLNYVYVLDEEKKLFGVLSIRQLFQHAPTAIAKDVCKKTNVVSLHPGDSEERAAYVALKNNIKAIPVIDHAKVFLGEVPNDRILSILHTEMHEDTLKKAGIGHEAGIHANVLKLTLLQSLRHRIPWLLVGLLGGVAVAKIVSSFESTLSENLILASFIPLIVYMSDAVRAQMEAYIIRDLAIDHFLPFGRYIFRHVLILFAIGLLLSSMLGLILFFTHDDPRIGVVLGASLCIAIFSSLFTGLIIPYLFEKCSLDPADASGPIATILQDMLSVLIYFGVASVLLV